ncbi:MAG: tetratricopeptide repeat protein [Alphaproteobacteria bacterium]|nr:tetratricopeptide repeat protein [Alphaproteobacteria bacterium]
MTMVTNASPKAGAKPNRRQRRQAVRQAKRGPKQGDATTGPSGQGNDIAGALDMAHRLHLAGDFETAIEHYDRVLARQRNNHNALLFLGLLGHPVGDDRNAVSLISRALRINPDSRSRSTIWRTHWGFWEDWTRP